MNEKDIFNVLKIKDVEIIECEQCNSRYTESDEQFELYEKTKLSRCPVCFNLDRLQTIYLQDDDTLEADEVHCSILLNTKLDHDVKKGGVKWN